MFLFNLKNSIEVELLYFFCLLFCFIRTTVLDEPLLRRAILHVRLRRDHVHRVGPGGQARPNDLRLPADDQVQLPHVRPLGRGRAARLPLHPPAQHSQREDLHLPLVLVLHPRRPQLRRRRLPARHHRQSPHEGVPPLHQVPAHQQGGVSENLASLLLAYNIILQR